MRRTSHQWAARGDSGFFVAWTDDNGSDIKGQFLTRNGARSGPEINPGDGPRPCAKLRRFDGGGDAVGEDVQVSTTDVDPVSRPDITTMIDGGCLVVWADSQFGQRIRARWFTPDGVPGSEFMVSLSEGDDRNPRAIRLADGNVVIAWKAVPPAFSDRLTYRVFDLEGVPGRARWSLTSAGSTRSSRWRCSTPATSPSPTRESASRPRPA